MSALEATLTIVTFILQLRILAAVLNGIYRRLPFLFLWATLSALQSVAVTAAVLDTGQWTAETARYYWIGEGILHASLFACVLHMLMRSVEDPTHRNRIYYLILGGLIYTALSSWQSYDPKLNRWMTQLIRNLSFGAMLMNFTLWMVLLKKPNRMFLLVSASFGIQLAGTAIGHSLRQMSASLVLAGNLIISLAFIVALYTMWSAVSAKVKKGAGPSRNPAELKDTGTDAGIEITPVIK